MPKTPRLDAIEAELSEHHEKIVKLEETVAELIPAPPVDPRDVPDPDGLTPRQRWIALCQDVVDQHAERGESISLDEANALLLAMPEFAPKQHSDET